MKRVGLKTINLNSFINKSVDYQIEYIEKRVEILRKKLPSLKRRLTMSDDKSDDLYNYTLDELNFATERYVESLKEGEITTKTSKRAYSNFITQLSLYTSNPINSIASMYTSKRMSSWETHVRALGLSEDEENYLDTLLDMMNERDKEAFVRSKYFLDVGKYTTQSAEFSQFTKEYGYNVVIIKLEIFLQNRGYDTEEIYKQIKGYSDNFKVKATRQKNKVYGENGKAFK